MISREHKEGRFTLVTERDGVEVSHHFKIDFEAVSRLEAHREPGCSEPVIGNIMTWLPKYEERMKSGQLMSFSELKAWVWCAMLLRQPDATPRDAAEIIEGVVGQTVFDRWRHVHTELWPAVIGFFGNDLVEDEAPVKNENSSPDSHSTTRDVSPVSSASLAKTS